jgi:hypothetical protein
MTEGFKTFYQALQARLVPPLVHNTFFPHVFNSLFFKYIAIWCVIYGIEIFVK